MVSPVSANELLEEARRVQAAAETEALQAIPGMTESIRAGMAESVEGLNAEPGWSC